MLKRYPQEDVCGVFNTILDHFGESFRFNASTFKAQLAQVIATRPDLWNKLRYDEFSLEPFWLDLSGVSLQNVEVCGLNFDNVSLAGSNLAGAKLVSSTFRHTDLSRSDLRSARLNGSELFRATFRNADLRYSVVRGASLHQADFTGANLVGAKFASIQDSQPGASFLDLATAIGLETATFDTPDYLRRYLEEAFDYCHHPDAESREGSDFEAEKKAALIKNHLDIVFRSEVLSPSAVKVLEFVSGELMRYLAKQPQELMRISPRQFEMVMAELLASRGWEVELTPATRDGGYDIFGVSVDMDGVRVPWLVECKRFSRERTVGVGVVRSLYGVRFLRSSAANIMLATTSRFSSDVLKLRASRYDLDLRDYNAIVEWLHSYQRR